MALKHFVNKKGEERKSLTEAGFLINVNKSVLHLRNQLSGLV
jgi:hypothetical protein